MKFQVDMNEYNSDGSEQYLIPHGEYVFKVVNVSNAESKKGLPQLKFEFELNDIPADWDYNKKVFHTITFIPMGEKGHGIAVHFLKEMGVKPDDNGVMSFDLDDFMNLKVIATCYQEKGLNGNTYNRLKDFKFYTPDVPAPHGQDENMGGYNAAEEDVPF